MRRAAVPRRAALASLHSRYRSWSHSAAAWRGVPSRCEGHIPAEQYARGAGVLVRMCVCVCPAPRLVTAWSNLFGVAMVTPFTGKTAPAHRVSSALHVQTGIRSRKNTSA